MTWAVPEKHIINFFWPKWACVCDTDITVCDKPVLNIPRLLCIPTSHFGGKAKHYKLLCSSDDVFCNYLDK